jgi:RNA polymerase sigma-70 factor (ECF subfamily)
LLETRKLNEVELTTQEYFPRIHRAALVLSGNPWDADDLAQETFLIYARSPEKFQGRSSIYTWLYGILLNIERKQRRRRGMHQQKLQVLSENTDPAQQMAPPAESSIEVSEWKTSLWKYVARLPDGQRQALVLRFSEGLRYEEIADILKCPVGTVKSRIFHGLAALRNALKGDQEIKEHPPHLNEDINHAI